MAPLEAALRGGAEVSFTVLSMSLSLIAVFLPILLMPGLLGRLFQEFAETLSIAILISLVVSLTTTPMLCALLLRAGESHGKSRWRIINWFESGFDAARGGYERSLRWALNHARLVGFSLILTIILNVVLFVIVPKGFFPEQDTGLLIGNITADQSISFGAMKTKLLQLQTIIQDDPGVQSVAGFTGGHATNSGFLFVTLKPLSARHISATAIVARLRKPLAKIAGAQTFLVPAQDLRVGGRQSNAEYQYTLKSDNAQDLYTWTPKIVTALQADKTLVDVSSDVQQGGLETDVQINRAQAAQYGITPDEVDQTLYDAFGQRTVSTIYNELNQYEVVMEFAPKYQQTPNDLARIYISTSGGNASGTSSTQLSTGAVSNAATAGSAAGSSAASATASIALDSATNAAVNSIAASGKSSGSSGAAVSTDQETMVPLAAIASIAPGSTPISVNHDGGSASATISFSLPQNVALSTGAAAITKTMAALDVPLTVTGSFAGTAAAFQSSSASEPLLILAALVTVYIVLGILYESTIHPLTIISTIPSAGLGATLILLVLNVPLTIIALIGIILLIGIVKKNAILMIDFALQLERGENLSPEEAIFRAASLRFRPIMMTSFAAILGAVPLAIALGQGASLRQPLGLTIIGGLAVSQALTLYTTPVVYLWLERLGAKLRGGQDKAAPRAGSIVEAT
jgi:multidrug efflux pump